MTQPDAADPSVFASDALTASARDQRWMRVALALARRGLGRAAPNPAVGCVIVQAGDRVVGRGWTQPGGRPHAEAEALARAGPAAEGATAYVTLEPCAHYGATPPCAGALAKAGVRRVVSALEDPDPRVAGRGHEILRAAGVHVDVGVCADAAAALNLGYLLRRDLGRPMTTVKLAATLDGRIATAGGESQWITGPDARRRAHLLRAEHDAILVGAGTVAADDPRLDVRLPGLGAASPVRVVADSRLSTPLDSALARSASTQPLWLLHAPDAPAERRGALADAGAVLFEVPRLRGAANAPRFEADRAGLDMAEALKTLGAQGMTRLLCEGGGRLAASLARAGLIDVLVSVVGGSAIGGDGRPSMAALELTRLADAPRWRLERMETVGPDLWSEWRAESSPALSSA